MREYIAENSAAIVAGGLKLAAGGGVTSIVFGITLNPADIQLLGVIGGLGIGSLGLVVTGIAKWYERKDRLKYLQWDGVSERRNRVRSKNDS